MNNIVELFKHWAVEKSDSGIVELLNRDKEPVAAIYLNQVNFDAPDIVVCETSKTSERYYLYMNGIAIFFTYYKRT